MFFIPQTTSKRTLPELGNDIVAKGEPPFHPRFAARVLAESEFARYLCHDKGLLFLLKAWAAKEAGYKYLRQRNPRLIIAPRRLIFDEDAMSLCAEGRSIALHFIENEKYIYCATCSPGENAVHEIASISQYSAPCPLHQLPVAQNPGTLPSHAVRLLAQKMIAHRLGLDEAQLAIHKDPSGAPYASWGTRRLPARLSMTHDGDFVAVALLLA